MTRFRPSATADDRVLLRTRDGARPPEAARVERRVLAFYYPWYETPAGETGRWMAWSNDGEEPQRREDGSWAALACTDQPLLGPYNSRDPDLLHHHVRQAQAHGIDGLISSWWHGKPEHDAVFGLLLDTIAAAGSPLAATVYYEGSGGCAERLRDDLEHILERHSSHPSFMRVDGAPVIFVYARALRGITAGAWRDVLAHLRERFDPVLSLDHTHGAPMELLRACGAGHLYIPVREVLQGVDMPGFYRRAAASHLQHGVISALPVLPGYDDSRLRSPSLRLGRRDGSTYRHLWNAVHAADPDWVLVTTFNEWNEGTQIEDSREFGGYYLHATRIHAMSFRERGGWLAIDPTLDGLPAGLRLDPQATDDRAVLLRDHRSGCEVLANPMDRPLRVRITWPGHLLVQVTPSVRSAAPAQAHVAGATAARHAETCELVLPPGDEVHFWPRDALRTCLARGAYGGAEELRDCVESGTFLRVCTPFLGGEDIVRTLVCAAGSRLRLRLAICHLDGRVADVTQSAVCLPDPYATLKRGELTIAQDTPPGIHTIAISAPASRPARVTLDVRDPVGLEVHAAGGKVRFEARQQVAILPPMDALSLTIPRWTSRIDDMPSLDLAGRAVTEVDLHLLRNGSSGGQHTAHLAWGTGAVSVPFRLCASIDLGNGVHGDGIDHTGTHLPEDCQTWANRCGDRACRTNALETETPNYFYFVLDPRFVHDGATHVSVEFFDEGALRMSLEYDSTDTGQPHEGIYKDAGEIIVGSTRVWRTHTFVLTDAHFRRRQNYYADFRLRSAGRLSVARVTVVSGLPGKR